MSAASEPGPGADGDGDGAVIALRGATLGYGGVPIVHGASFEVHAGRRSRSSARTGRASPPSSERSPAWSTSSAATCVLGEPVAHLSDRWRVGYVPQASSIGDVGLTVRELVSTGRLPRMSPWRPMGRTDRQAVADAIALVDLAGQDGRRIGQLSGGQLRRALIARSLAAEPEILLLDEPTAGVDAATRASLADSLRSLHDAGTTIVLVSHEIGPVEELVDRVVALREGRIDYDGPPRPGDRMGDGTHHHDHDHHPEAIAPVGGGLASGPMGGR
ncbi:MAG: ATP-binding cassette domain-containing protein [Acidimicrobiales bacterium]